VLHPIRQFNLLPLLFKSLLPGQEDCVFFSGHLNLHAKPETGIPYREKNYNNQTKNDRMIILSYLIRQTTESYSFIHTTQYIYEETNQYVRDCRQHLNPVHFSTLGTAKG
jgi:hypothetical protein